MLPLSAVIMWAVVGTAPPEFRKLHVFPDLASCESSSMAIVAHMKALAQPHIATTVSGKNVTATICKQDDWVPPGAWR